MRISDDYVDQDIDIKDKWHVVRGTWGKSADALMFKEHADEENPEGLLLYEIPLSTGEISAELSIMDDPQDVTEPIAHIVLHFMGNDDFCVAGIGGWDSLYVIGRRVPPVTSKEESRWERLETKGHLSEIKKSNRYPITVRFTPREIELCIGSIPMFRADAGYRRQAGVFGLRAFGDCRARFLIKRVVRRIRRSDVGARLADLDLSFMHHDTLRSVAERDLHEARGFDADYAPKATVVLLGSVAEALLLDALWHRNIEESGSTGVTDDNLNEWKFYKLIDKANGTGMISKQIYATSHILRGYRNLVHPANEAALELGPRPAQAVAGIDFLLNLIKDLSTDS
jgi:hypothetical protein